MKTIKEMLYNEDGSKKTVVFGHYQKGNLWYSIEGENFGFPVPIEDTGDAIFLSKDQAPYFMRYIRKHMELTKNDSSTSSS